jgi:hypothetical protein
MRPGKIEIFVNEHGSWRIERIEAGIAGVNLRPRWLLWFWSKQHNQWALVANQGRRKTCIELADSNYKGGHADL